ncbi:tRNA pseudouridine(55) synthase TruB [candidate division WOR-3 bacterium]|uniref:tRNA pseudouridine synthase B n=1 Tax=candidate division TA06 bacterium TaxID=2250710 RepID=A0A660SA32_UNCT6|nr:tRNA pseudouridine(55) synthase TruB [candidate division WOR-3 bacterium]RKX67648.1 MAG: tRNA pseudouridine(55) synthase TruB [candidate division TA06 bacterium]
MVLTRATTGYHSVTNSNFNRCLLIDKTPGITTFDIIRKLRVILGNKLKIGHGGTLDPFASGLVIILTGHYTKLQSFIQHSQKQYEGTIELGYETDTLDIEGEKVIISKNTIPETIDIKAIENHVLSLKEQFPPKFSAIKVNGTPMYKLARKKVDVKPKKREIKVFEFNIHNYKKPYIHFNITVSGGTYIRSIAKAIGDFIKIPSTLVELRRTGINEINIKKAVLLDNLKSIKNIEESSIDINHLLKLPVCEIDEIMFNRIKNGRDIETNPDISTDETILLKYKDKFVAIGTKLADNRIHPKKVLV